MAEVQDRTLTLADVAFVSGTVITAAAMMLLRVPLELGIVAAVMVGGVAGVVCHLIER